MGGQNVKSIYQNGTFLVELDDCVKINPKRLISLNQEDNNNKKND